MTKRSILAVLLTGAVASGLLVAASPASAATQSYANPITTAVTTDLDIPSADIVYDLTQVTVVLHVENVSSPSVSVQALLADGDLTTTTGNLFIVGASQSSQKALNVNYSSKSSTGISGAKNDAVPVTDVAVSRDAAAGTFTFVIPRSHITWPGASALTGYVSSGGAQAYFAVLVSSTLIRGVGPLAIYPVPTLTTAVLSSKHQTYGKKAATLTAAISPAVPGVVTVSDGARVVATAPAPSGSATITLPKKLASGHHELVATFTPTAASDWAVSASAPLAFGVTSVAKPTKTTVALSSKTQRYKHTSAKIHVTVSHKAAGKVAIFDGRKKIKTLTLKKGKATYTLSKKLKKGSHTIKVVFTPTHAEAFTASTKIVKLKVTK